MEFAIMGSLEVRESGKVVALGGRKQRQLMALLLLNANEVVPTDRLIDQLWADEPPATAASVLQVYISNLRKALEPGLERGRSSRLIVTRSPGYMLEIDPDQVDAALFERLLGESRTLFASGDSSGAAEGLREALALWRGPALADFAYEDFAQAEIGRLEELRRGALEDRIEADLAVGRHAELIGELESLVAAYPLRERLRGQLMLALYRSGRQAEALSAYQDARHTLVETLGIEPGPALQALEQAILNQDSGLTGPAPTQQPFVPARPKSPFGAFVGRERDLAELHALLDDAVGGRGRLVLLSGEPGIGKSRLAEELMDIARARGAQVLVGRCWEAGGAPAYWPWVQSLRTYVRESAAATLHAQLGTGATAVAQIVPELQQRFPKLPELPSLDPESARFRLFDATAEFLRKASEHRAILLVLDDLHAADTPSLLLMQFLARQLHSSRIFLLGAFRDVDPLPGDALSAMLAEVTREPITRRLALSGLSEQDVAEYVALTAADLASPELIATLHEETEGNPLFIAETVRLLAQEGMHSEAAGTSIVFPQSVRDVIARRLAHLSEECNHVLILASVLGREFAGAALARMSDLSQDELFEILDEAVAARIILEVPGAPGRLRFAHVLIRDTLYESLTMGRRLRLHRLAVDALETLYGKEPGAHLAELAHHSVAGSDLPRGLRYARRAGDHALELLAYEEAARLYETALDTLDASDSPDEKTGCQLLLSLGEAKARAGDMSAARDAFLEAADAARALGLSRELARAAVGYGGRIVWARAGGDSRIVPLLEESLASLPAEDAELRIRILSRLAGALRDDRSRDRRDSLSREAVDVARRIGNPAALAYALDSRVSAIIAPDTIAECVALSSELCDISERIGDTEELVHGLILRSMGRFIRGDVREAEVDLDSAARVADELRQPAQLWLVRATQAMLALALGSLNEAGELVPEALTLGERAQPEWAVSAYTIHQYTFGDFQGRPEESEAPIRSLVAAYPSRPVFRCALAHLYAKQGRSLEASQELADLAGDTFSAIPFDVEWLFGMSLLAETAALLDDTGSGAVLYELLLPWAAWNAADMAEGIRGSISHYLGLLAAASERLSDAEQHFEDALNSNERMGLIPWLARTRHEYARMLLARDGPGDRERAERVLGEAQTAYRELGMNGYAAEAAVLAGKARFPSADG